MTVVVYPLESVASNEKEFDDTAENVFAYSPPLAETLSPLIFLDEIDAELFAVALSTHLAFDIYLTSLEESPVSAAVILLVSIIEPVTVGLHADSFAVAVNVHVVAVPITVVLEDELYVLHVIVHVPFFAFGICV